MNTEDNLLFFGFYVKLFNKKNNNYELFFQNYKIFLSEFEKLYIYNNSSMIMVKVRNVGIFQFVYE